MKLIFTTYLAGALLVILAAPLPQGCSCDECECQPAPEATR